MKTWGLHVPVTRRQVFVRFRPMGVVNMHSNENSIGVIHCFRSPIGGLFRHVHDLVCEQHGRGMQIGIICDASTGDDIANRKLAAIASHCALGVHRLPMARIPSWSDARVARAMAQLCHRLQPQILHGHGAKGGAYARLVARTAGARSVYTPHGGSLHYSAASPVGLLYLGLERGLKHRTDGLLFESRFSAALYARKIGGLACPARVVPNGLRDEEFDSITPGADAFDFAFVGEFRMLKGLETLLSALTTFRRQRLVRVLIAGAGPDGEWLQQQIRARALESVVTLSPPIHPARRAFAQARCVVIPSHAESFPYIVLEAAAARMPLITTCVGGIPEIYGPYAGHLLPPHDPAALAAAMVTFMDRPDAAATLAGHLQQRVSQHFRVERMANEIIDFYRCIM